MNIKNIYEKSKKAINRLVKPDMGEMSHSGTNIWGMGQTEVYNPDSLVGKKGLSIYRKMQQRDGQVKAVFMLKKHARLSTPWKIRAADEEDKEAVRQKEFIEHCFSEMDGSINNFLLKIWNVMRDGYAVAELNYKVIETGDFQGMVGLKNIKVRAAEDFSFKCDEFGNIDEKGLIEGNTTNLPINKFVIVSYNPSDDNSESLYGESDFRAAYRYYFSNDILQRFWNIYLEKFGQPTIVGRYPPGTKKTKQDDYLEILKSIQSDSVLVMPQALEAEFLEAERRGEPGYKIAYDTNNNMIARALLVGSLIMDTGEKGSYALSKTHFDVFIYVLNYLGEETQDTIMREQIIKRLIDFNFPDPKYPYFEFESLIKDDQEGKAKIAKMLVDARLINPEEEWVREYLKIPAKEKDIVLPEPKKTGGEFTADFTAGLSRPLNQYEKKCNFTRIISNLDKYEAKAKEELSKIIERQKETLKKAIVKAKIIENNNANEIEKLQLSYVGEFRDTIHKWLQELWRYGHTEVQAELKQYKYVGILTGKAMENLLKNKSFHIAGIARDDILKEAKTILYSGAKNGLSADEIMFELDKYFQQYIGSPGIETRDGKLLTPYHLENIVRTNFSDAYNQGRLDMMRDPDVRSVVTGGMFSAVMDDRTTPICQSLDGQVFEIGDPDLGRFTPPLHYLCRSTVVPITKYETFKPITPELKARALPMKGKNF